MYIFFWPNLRLSFSDLCPYVRSEAWIFFPTRNTLVRSRGAYGCISYLFSQTRKQNIIARGHRGKHGRRTCGGWHFLWTQVVAHYIDTLASKDDDSIVACMNDGPAEYHGRFAGEEDRQRGRRNHSRNVQQPSRSGLTVNMDWFELWARSVHRHGP